MPEVQELLQWAGSTTCDDFQGRFLEAVRRRLEEVDRRMADLERLKQDLLHLEAHFGGARKEVKADHTMLECSPDTCRCLGNMDGNRGHSQEVTLWLEKPEFNG